MPTEKRGRKRGISYAKWGYFFIAPFFLIFVVFNLVPLLSTFVFSFFEMYRDGLTQVGPNFVGFANYASLMNSELLRFFSNTIVIWLMGFIPQLLFSLLLASWFTSLRLRLRAQGLFKTIIYMPNLVMATAFSMLFFALFSDSGPVNSLLISAGILGEPFRFLSSVWGTRSIIALMNFLMWYGNTTILLMAAIMGVDTSLFEAAQIDGATSFQLFRKVTLPLIRPILLYVLITSLIGGLQMFDLPQILTNGNGNPNRTSMTMVMYLNKHLYSKNFGMGGAVSVLLFIASALLSVLIYKLMFARGKEGRVK